MMEAPNNDKLDTTIELITPENIVFRYYLAGPAHRIPAFLIDCICQFVIFMATSFALVFLTFYFPMLEEIIDFVFLVSIFVFFGFMGGFWKVFGMAGRSANGPLACVSSRWRAYPSRPFRR